MAMECLAKVAVAAPSCVAISGASPSQQLAYSAPLTASPLLFSRPCLLQAVRMGYPSNRRGVVAMASPPSNIGDKLSQSIKEAEEVCAAEGGGGECAAAWDEVEELSAEIAHKRVQSSDSKDPLEQYCKDAPEADECRVYED